MSTNSQRSITETPNCVCFNVRKTARLLNQVYDGYLVPAGIKSTQFTVLQACKILGPSTVTALAEQLLVERTTLTRNLKVLETQGLVAIRAGNDARSRRVELTARGRKVAEKAYVLWRQAQTSLVKKFGANRWADLQKDLATIDELAKIMR